MLPFMKLKINKQTSLREIFTAYSTFSRNKDSFKPFSPIKFIELHKSVYVKLQFLKI